MCVFRLCSATVLARLLTRREQYVALRWFRCMSICYLLRCCTLGLTMLPGPADHCRNEYTLKPVG